MAGFFNTSWDLANMFNSGGGGNNFSYDSSGMPLMNTDMSNPWCWREGNNSLV